MKETQIVVLTVPVVRIIKIATCLSLSGQSTLTYHVGCNAESEVYFRVHANSSRGYFSREWVGTDSIGKALAESSAITSFTLLHTYKGKSQNNGGFMLAVLLAEGLVSRFDRQYLIADPDEFNASVKALMESAVSLDADAKTPNADAKSKKSKKVA
ncbi:MAG: hypothetical protein WC710_09300 [Gallionella sp.]|jgi:hypothetical protein